MSCINWNGCWEVRDGRTICRWMVAWKSLNNAIVGCIDGYSGGGTFQLEKFYVDNKRILTSDIRAFEELLDEEIRTAEDCQDEVLNFHDQTIWLDCDNLVLASKCAVSFQGREDLLFGGKPLPSAITRSFQERIL